MSTSASILCITPLPPKNTPFTLQMHLYCNLMTSNHIWVVSNCPSSPFPFATCVWMLAIYLLSSSAYYGICMPISTQVHEPLSTADLSSSSSHSKAQQHRYLWVRGGERKKKKTVTLPGANPLSNCSLLKTAPGVEVKPHRSLPGGLTSGWLVTVRTTDYALVRLAKSSPHWLPLKLGMSQNTSSLRLSDRPPAEQPCLVENTAIAANP